MNIKICTPKVRHFWRCLFLCQKWTEAKKIFYIIDKQNELIETKEKRIVIDIFIRFFADIEINEIELGIVLVNALDNTIEAVEKISDGENKTIQFKLISIKDRISISIENPVKDNVDVNKLSTTKVNKIFHGCGVERIKQIARKYDGFAKFTCEDKYFTVNINIANTQPKR